MVTADAPGPDWSSDPAGPSCVPARPPSTAGSHGCPLGQGHLRPRTVTVWGPSPHGDRS